jgi:hypothetical protein
MSDRLTLNGLQREIDRLDADQSKHEDECTIRYVQLNQNIAELKDGMKWVIRLAIGIMVALIGWLLVALYENNATMIERAAAGAERVDARAERAE